MLEFREDVPDPSPAAGEVLIRVGAAGLNNTDIWTREGAYGTETAPDGPLVWATYPLAELSRAQTDFMQKGFFGKLVVTP